MVDALTGGAIWGVGFGLATLAVSSLGGARPLVKGAVRGAVTAGRWAKSATDEGRETLQDLYHEARAKRAATATPEPEA
jgi:hypothetical protein